MRDAGTNTQIVDNLFGVGPDGLAQLGNGNGTAGDAGIFVQDGTPDIIGNTIAFTAGRGIRATAAANPTVRGNSIFLNDGLGFDFDDDSAADAPCCFTISSVTTGPGGTTISGTSFMAQGITWSLDFYDSAACDLSGFGEGERYLGLLDGVQVNVSDPYTFVTALGVTPGRVVTVTMNSTMVPTATTESPPARQWLSAAAAARTVTASPTRRRWRTWARQHDGDCR